VATQVRIALSLTSVTEVCACVPFQTSEDEGMLWTPNAQMRTRCPNPSAAVHDQTTSLRPASHVTEANSARSKAAS